MPGLVAAVDIQTVMTQMQSKTFTRVESYVLVMESSVTTIAVRDLVSLSLTIPVLAADVDVFCKTMALTFEARTGKALMWQSVGCL